MQTSGNTLRGANDFQVLRRVLSLSLLSMVLAAMPARAQDVAEIPLFNAPDGTAALGGGLRFGQSPYLAPDNEDQRQVDLIPMYLYEGRYLFARGTQGGLHIIRNDLWELNLLLRYRFQKLDPDSNSFYQGLEEQQTVVGRRHRRPVSTVLGEINASWVVIR